MGAARVFGDVYSVNPSYQLCSASVSWANFAGSAFLAQILLLAISVAGCDFKFGRGSAVVVRTVSGSSMEPNFHGERLQCTCDDCQQVFFLASDTVSDRSDIRCPRCLGPAKALGVISPDSVSVVLIDPGTNLARYDCVVVREPSSNRLELKRIIGLPNESIRIIQGDVWVNGERAQKMPQQFLDQAVFVGEWKELSNTQPTPGAQYRFRNTNFSFGNTTEPSSKLSPIHDDYPTIASKALWPSIAKDIGIVLELDVLPREPTEFLLELSIDETASVLITVALEPNVVSVMQASLSSCENVSPRWLSKANSPFVSVAYVDGRVIASLGRRPLAVQVARNESGIVSPSIPLAFSVLRGNLGITKAHVVRDLVYRGENGEEEFTLPRVFGYHLLGDGVPISHDSRQRWPNGVPRAWILGRVDRN